MLAELSAVGTVLMVDINATDADSGSNAQITYSIANDDTGSFHIDSITGRLFKIMFRPHQIFVISCVLWTCYSFINLKWSSVKKKNM